LRQAVEVTQAGEVGQAELRGITEDAGVTVYVVQPEALEALAVIQATVVMVGMGLVPVAQPPQRAVAAAVVELIGLLMLVVFLAVLAAAALVYLVKGQMALLALVLIKTEAAVVEALLEIIHLVHLIKTVAAGVLTVAVGVLETVQILDYRALALPALSV
jgi:hypothetical protein